VENQARRVNGQVRKVKRAQERWKLTRKWLVEGARQGARAGRKAAVSQGLSRRESDRIKRQIVKSPLREGIVA
jgi:hypothetical protein